MMDDLRAHIQRLREDFSKGILNENEVDAAPSQQFKLWLQQAVESRVAEVQAMDLCTVSEKGRPSSRIVYMREFHDDQYWFYTNYNSRKSRDLEKNPRASATFFWKELERQVRIEGIVRKASAEESDAYFNARPYDSKIGAWASAQSDELHTRKDLDQRVEFFQKKFTPETIKRPDFWGGFILQAEYYEFWQGRKSRLHDRIIYTLNDAKWDIARIAP